MEETIEQRYLTRIDQLLKKLGQVGPQIRNPFEGFQLAESDLATFQECFTASLSLADNLYGTESPQARELLGFVARFQEENLNTVAARCRPILMGFLRNVGSEIAGGLIASLTERGYALAVADFVELADQMLEAGQKEASAVLAAAALEDAAKRKAVQLGIDVEGRSLSEVVNALKGESYFTGAGARLVPSFVTLRNKAMHAEWDKIQPADVASLVAYLRRFLAERF